MDIGGLHGMPPICSLVFILPWCPLGNHISDLGAVSSWWLWSHWISAKEESRWEFPDYSQAVQQCTLVWGTYWSLHSPCLEGAYNPGGEDEANIPMQVTHKVEWLSSSASSAQSSPILLNQHCLWRPSAAHLTANASHSLGPSSLWCQPVLWNLYVQFCLFLGTPGLGAEHHIFPDSFICLLQGWPAPWTQIYSLSPNSRLFPSSHSLQMALPPTHASSPLWVSGPKGTHL